MSIQLSERALPSSETALRANFTIPATNTRTIAAAVWTKYCETNHPALMPIPLCHGLYCGNCHCGQRSFPACRRGLNQINSYRGKGFGSEGRTINVKRTQGIESVV